MTEPLFFDTDCLSAFLWTDQGSLVTRLYPNRIVIPQTVVGELSRVSTPSFRERIGLLISSHSVIVRDIEISSNAFPLYREMTGNPKPGFKTIGKGEAAAIALAIAEKGIVASNNFRDTAAYIKAYKLPYKTTGSILVDAYEQAFISEKEANDLWADMIAEGCWIGARSFTEFYDAPIDPLGAR